MSTRMSVWRHHSSSYNPNQDQPLTVVTASRTRSALDLSHQTGNSRLEIARSLGKHGRERPDRMLGPAFDRFAEHDAAGPNEKADPGSCPPGRAEWDAGSCRGIGMPHFSRDWASSSF